MKVYIGAIGGLGDVIRTYFTDLSWIGLRTFKEQNPSSIIKAIIVSHNIQSKVLVETNPYIDIVSFHNPKREMRDKHWNERQVIEQYSNEFRRLQIKNTKDTQQLFLTKDENKLVDTIREAGPYILLHPFASEPSRIPLSPQEYIPIIDRIISNKMNVVVVGGSFKKSFGPAEIYNKQETFTYQTDNLFNLVGKTNSRVATILTKHSKQVLATWSAYCVAAWTFGIKTITLTTPKEFIGCNKLHNGKYKNHHPSDKVLVPEYDNIIKEVLND